MIPCPWETCKRTFSNFRSRIGVFHYDSFLTLQGHVSRLHKGWPPGHKHTGLDTQTMRNAGSDSASDEDSASPSEDGSERSSDDSVSRSDSTPAPALRGPAENRVQPGMPRTVRRTPAFYSTALQPANTNSAPDTDHHEMLERLRQMGSDSGTMAAGATLVYSPLDKIVSGFLSALD